MHSSSGCTDAGLSCQLLPTPSLEAAKLEGKEHTWGTAWTLRWQVYAGPHLLAAVLNHMTSPSGHSH